MTTEDHRGGDLAGTSLAGAQLDGTDFREADLRGTDLSRASLVGANFSDAKLGLRRPAAIALMVASLLIVGATGWFIGWTLRDLADGIGDAEWEEVFGRVLAMFVVGAFLLAVLAFGLMRALRYGAVLIVAALGVNYIVIGLSSGAFNFARDGRVVGAALLLSASMIAGGIARVVGGSLTTWAIVVVGLTGGYAAGQGGGGIAGVVVSVLLVVLAKRALRVDRRDRFVRRLVHGIVDRRGTRFTGADLSEADLSGTVLAQCDFTGATLVGTKIDDIKGWPPFIDDPSADD